MENCKLLNEVWSLTIIHHTMAGNNYIPTFLSMHDAIVEFSETVANRR